MNESFFRFVNGFAGRYVALDAAIVFFTDSAGIVLVFALLLYAMHAFYHGARKQTLRIIGALASAGVAWCVSFVGKILIAAPRPVILLPEVRELIAYGAHDAFPSGHATFYFALAGALFLHDKKLGTAALVVAAMISLARVAAGIHWPGDILAGAALGMLVSLVANRLISYYTATR